MNNFRKAIFFITLCVGAFYVLALPGDFYYYYCVEFRVIFDYLNVFVALILSMTLAGALLAISLPRLSLRKTAAIAVYLQGLAGVTFAGTALGLGWTAYNVFSISPEVGIPLSLLTAMLLSLGVIYLIIGTPKFKYLSAKWQRKERFLFLFIPGLSTYSFAMTWLGIAMGCK